jgi:hypothetical protein
MVAPAFFALTLVLTVRPIHRWLVRKGLPPWLSGLSTMAALAAVLLGTVGLTVWSLVGLPDTLSKYKGSFEDIVRQLRDLAAKYDFDFDTAKLQDELLKNLDFDRILEMVSTLVNYLTSAGSLIALIALAMLFITVDTMTMDFRSRVLANHDSSLHEALCGFEGRVRQYWLVSTIFGIIVAVIDGIVLWFLDVPLPVAWVMVSFITNYIPNIGFVMGVIPPAVMALVDSGWVTAVWVIALYSIINFVIQGIFQPKITGDAVGLSTTITFLSLIFWTVVIGPLGAILAVPPPPPRPPRRRGGGRSSSSPSRRRRNVRSRGYTMGRTRPPTTSSTSWRPNWASRRKRGGKHEGDRPARVRVGSRCCGRPNDSLKGKGWHTREDRRGTYRASKAGGPLGRPSPCAGLGAASSARFASADGTIPGRATGRSDDGSRAGASSWRPSSSSWRWEWGRSAICT